MIDLRFESVGKRYRIREQSPVLPPGARMIEKLRGLRPSSKDFWAVKDVSFEVRSGEALGIVGHNGAGKSTVLKLLSNITTPTTGRITIHGRIAALLEVGSGFHPELTGRENMFLSGSILGMRRAEIARKMESIVEFAGVRQFLDTPVKRYSSGMYVRLGFSIAAHLDADILLLDEVLAVGDAAFQEKCRQRIAELRKRGMTIVFISHDLTAVSRLCDRALLMERGRIRAQGSPDDIIREYTDAASFRPDSRLDPDQRTAEITSVMFLDSAGNPTSGFSTGGALGVRVNYVLHRDLARGSISVFFYSTDRTLQTQISTKTSGRHFSARAGDAGSIEFCCRELGLQPGLYEIDACLDDLDSGNTLEWQFQCTTIYVEGGAEIRGRFRMPHDWRYASTPVPDTEADGGKLYQRQS